MSETSKCCTTCKGRGKVWVGNDFVDGDLYARCNDCMGSGSAPSAPPAAPAKLELQDVEQWERELLEAGWLQYKWRGREHRAVWQAPNGELFRGSYGAWRMMQSWRAAYLVTHASPMVAYGDVVHASNQSCAICDAKPSAPPVASGGTETNSQNGEDTLKAMKAQGVTQHVTPLVSSPRHHIPLDLDEFQTAESGTGTEAQQWLAEYFESPGYKVRSDAMHLLKKNDIRAYLSELLEAHARARCAERLENQKTMYKLWGEIFAEAGIPETDDEGNPRSIEGRIRELTKRCAELERERDEAIQDCQERVPGWMHERVVEGMKTERARVTALTDFLELLTPELRRVGEELPKSSWSKWADEAESLLA